MCKKTDSVSYKVLGEQKNYGFSVCKYSWDKTLKYIKKIVEYFGMLLTNSTSCYLSPYHLHIFHPFNVNVGKPA